MWYLAWFLSSKDLLNNNIDKKLMKILKTLAIFFTLTPVFLIAQSGASIQVGPMIAFSPDKNVTSSGNLHYGWTAGIDARLMGDGMYFILGAQYQNMSLASTSSPDFFKNDFSVLGGRGGLGFTIVRLSHKSSIRTKALASFNFIMNAPNNALNKPGYDLLNDSYLGAVTGIGLTMGALDFDIEYQHGFINAYNKQPKSTINNISLLVGFNF